MPGVQPLEPGATIGILGGGQLGRMLALAAAKLGLAQRLARAKEKLAWVESAAYRASLRGTIGADPLGESPQGMAVRTQTQEQEELKLAS